MADKLSITIALEGGKAIEQQLSDIGSAGQKAFQDIQKSAQAVGGFKNLKPEEVTASLKQMGVTGEDALKKISAAVQSATRLESLVGVVQSVETGFAAVGAAASALGRALGPIGVAAGAVGTAVVKGMLDAATAISKADAQAIKLGLSIDKFSQIKQGFEAFGASASQAASGMGAIGKAIEQAKFEAVGKEVERINNELKAGLGGVGLSQFSKLIDAAAGVGPAAEAAKKALADFNITQENVIKTLPEFINKMGGDAVKGVMAFVQQLNTMPDSANRTARALAGLDEAGVALVQGFRNGTITGDQFGERWTNLTQKQANTSNALQASFNKLNSSYENLKTTLFAQLGDAGLTRIVEGFNTMLKGASWEQWAAAAKASLDMVLGAIETLAGKIAGFVAQLGGDIWSAFSDAGVAAFNAISGALDGLISKLASIGSAIGGILRGGGEPGSVTPIPGNAAGGLIGGSGSGTSDSNLAWVSRGEHIMPAAVVAQPGVLSLLESLRRGGGFGMGRFALGGVVPRFAGGGLVGAGGMGGRDWGIVNLHLSDGTHVAGGVERTVFQALKRGAVTQRITSTGKKPGFIS